MSARLSRVPERQLWELLQQSRQVLETLYETVNARKDLQDAILQLIGADDMFTGCSEMATKDPDLMEEVLQAMFTAQVNFGIVEEVSAELKRRGNANT